MRLNGLTVGHVAARSFILRCSPLLRMLLIDTGARAAPCRAFTMPLLWGTAAYAGVFLSSSALEGPGGLRRMVAELVLKRADIYIKEKLLRISASGI